MMGFQHKRKGNKTKWIGIILTFVLIGFLFLFIDFKKAWQIYSHISWDALGLSIVIYFISIVLRALRFNWLIDKGSPQKISIKKLLPIVLVHQFYNRLLPFRTGEASYVVLLKTVCQCEVSSGLSSLIVARIYDAFSVMMIFLASLFFFAGEHKFSESYGIALSFLIAIPLVLWKLPFLIKICRYIFFGIAEKVYNKKMPQWFFQIKKTITEIEVEISNVNQLRSVLWLLSSSLGIWTGIFGMFYMFMHACHLIPLSMDAFWQVVMGATLSIYTFVLPINVISGPMEASWTIGFVMVGIDKNAALASGFGINWLSHIATAAFALPAMIFLSRKN